MIYTGTVKIDKVTPYGVLPLEIFFDVEKDSYNESSDYFYPVITQVVARGRVINSANISERNTGKLLQMIENHKNI